MNTRIRMITRTAIFLALIITAQWLTGMLSQFVTGSAVNLILVSAALLLGLPSGLIIAVCSPILAFLAGIGPAFPQILPVIMLGNAMIVAMIWLIAGRGGMPRWWRLLAVLAGAAGKALILWIGIAKIALSLIPGLNAKQIETLSYAFSWPQLVTALIGGTLAVLIYPVLSKVIRQTS